MIIKDYFQREISELFSIDFQVYPQAVPNYDADGYKVVKIN